MARKGKVSIFRGTKRRFHWLVESANGQPIALSPPRGYTRLTDAKRAVRRVARIVAGY